MFHRLKGWIADKRAKQRKKGKEENAEPEPDLPFFLNAEKDLLPIANIQSQAASIFSKLPLEIRRKILIKAFGARRVHMDLFYDHPYISIPGENEHPQHAHYGGEYDTTRPKYWQWRGCVCHRTTSPEVQRLSDKRINVRPTNRKYDPYSPYPSWDLGEERNRLRYSDEPGDDICFTGYAYQCGTYIYCGDDAACWIGATGWLLTCRQAYIEGVEVLYGTNTIHISSKALLTRLPCDIPTPPRLLFLQSIEIVWNLKTVQLPRGWALNNPDRREIRQDQLKQILAIILDDLFHLRRLHLALVVKRALGADLYLDNTVQLLDVFAAQLCRRGSLKVPLQVSITSSIYTELYKEAKEVAANKDIIDSDLRFQFWRYVNGRCALAPSVQEEFCGIDRATVENGYWIVRGDKDVDKRLTLVCGYW